MRRPVVAVLHLLLSATAAAPVAAATQGFYQRGEEGWFWYRDPPPPPADRSPPESTGQPQTRARTEDSLPPPREDRASGPAPLSAQWLKENLPRYRMRAIDDPSPDNVRAYLYLQRVTMDKSTAFARMVKTVTIGDPFLDEIARHPNANYATNTLARARARATREVLGQLAGSVGLFFFFRADCDLCEAQAQVLEVLERNHGFLVKAISLDGRPLGGGRYPHYAIDQGQARALGVVQTPALFLVRPPDTTLALGQGAMAADDIEQRILIKAADNGWIDRDTFLRTRSYDEVLPLLPEGPGLREAVEDPATLVDYLRRQARSERNDP